MSLASRRHERYVAASAAASAKAAACEAKAVTEAAAASTAAVLLRSETLAIAASLHGIAALFSGKADGRGADGPGGRQPGGWVEVHALAQSLARFLDQADQAGPLAKLRTIVSELVSHAADALEAEEAVVEVVTTAWPALIAFEAGLRSSASPSASPSALMLRGQTDATSLTRVIALSPLALLATACGATKGNAGAGGADGDERVGGWALAHARLLDVAAQAALLGESSGKDEAESKTEGKRKARLAYASVQGSESESEGSDSSGESESDEELCRASAQERNIHAVTHTTIPFVQFLSQLLLFYNMSFFKYIINLSNQPPGGGVGPCEEAAGRHHGQAIG